MSELKPGLCKATVRGVPDVEVFIDGAGYGRTADYVLDYRGHSHTDITDARPLIVLDPAPHALEFVVDNLRRTRHSWTLSVADQIEAQFKPAPRPLTPPLALVALIRGADTSEQGAQLLEMWLAQNDPTLIREGTN